MRSLWGSVREGAVTAIDIKKEPLKKRFFVAMKDSAGENSRDRVRKYYCNALYAGRGLMTIIEDVYDKGKGVLLFSASGHAQGVQGEPNIVCAAVSMLCYTLLKSCLDLQEKGYLAALSHEFTPGAVTIEARAKGQGRDKLKLPLRR